MVFKNTFSHISALATSAALAGLLLLGPGAAAQDQQSFDSYFATLLDQSRSKGISSRTIEQVRPSVSLNTTALRIERKARGGSTDPNRRIPPFTGSDEQRAIIGKARPGKSVYQRLQTQLTQIERDLGVPPGVILAIYGKESNFGSYTGNFDTLGALASLAYEGRRRALFEKEFHAALQMIDQGTPRDSLRGSFAGAMGKPQFLPSVYLRLAVDADGDGQKDIWNSEADAMASIANYLKNAGWKRGQRWGMAVAVPSTFNRASVKSSTVPQRCPRVFARHSKWLTVAEWRALGIVPVSARTLPDDELATLLEPDFAGNTAYLLTGNYRAILDYNCSNFYALSVGLLADEIAS